MWNLICKILLEKNLWVRQFLYNSAKRAIQIVKKSFQIKDINVRVSEVSSFDGFIYLTLGALVPWDTVIGRRTTFPLVKDARIKGLPYTKWVTLLVRFQVLSNRKLANNFYSFQKVKNENKKHNNKKDAQDCQNLYLFLTQFFTFF